MLYFCRFMIGVGSKCSSGKIRKGENVPVYIHPYLGNNEFDKFEHKTVGGQILVAQSCPLVVFGEQQWVRWFQPFAVFQGDRRFFLSCIVEANEKSPKQVRVVQDKHTGRLVS